MRAGESKERESGKEREERGKEREGRSERRRKGILHNRYITSIKQVYIVY